MNNDYARLAAESVAQRAHPVRQLPNIPPAKLQEIQRAADEIIRADKARRALRLRTRSFRRSAKNVHPIRSAGSEPSVEGGSGSEPKKP